MQYAILAMESEDDYATRVDPKRSEEYFASWAAYAQAIADSGIVRAGAGLEGPTFGMSVWWRDHADHHMRMLMSPDGPFADSRDTNAQGEPLPYAAPPVGMFVDVRLLPN